MLDENNNTTGLLSLVKSDGREFIPIHKVVRLEADGSCTWIYFSDGRKVMTTKNLGHYERILPKPHVKFKNTFFRLHHGHVINLSYLISYNNREKYVLVSSGDRIPVAQRRQSRFSRMMKAHYLM